MLIHCWLLYFIHFMHSKSTQGPPKKCHKRSKRRIDQAFSLIRYAKAQTVHCSHQIQVGSKNPLSYTMLAAILCYTARLYCYTAILLYASQCYVIVSLVRWWDLKQLPNFMRHRIRLSKPDVSSLPDAVMWWEYADCTECLVRSHFSLCCVTLSRRWAW